jgi:hypothetical protein
MSDSLQKISEVTQLVLIEEQLKQIRLKNKKPTFKQLIADAVWEAYNKGESK